jgi:hypothetical protein
MGRVGALFAGLVFLLAGGPAAAKPPAERDWSAALREDAQALHDDIAANHPGPLNPQDPGFAKRNRDQLSLALRRASGARSYADYFFALREYVAAFNDGHMTFGAMGNTPNDFRWPGFLTAYDSFGDVRVVQTTNAVPVGAKLLGCDAMTAESYAAATLGKMWGRWQLRSQRLRHGSSLFLDDGSRYIPRARRCSFEVEGKKRAVALAWQPIAVRDAFGRMAAMMPSIGRTFEARRLDDGTRWFAIPSFNGDPQSDAGKALPALLEDMRKNRAALAAAPRIVLDLRGNGGGSSDWPRQIAEILWGRGAVERRPPAKVAVDWRVSRTNLEWIETTYAKRAAGRVLSPQERRWFESVIKGLTGALARGEGLWRHGADGTVQDKVGQAGPGETPPPPLTGPVYLVTDAYCASACLDAVDLWRAMRAVHVGQTTSADTLYMEIRQLRLPSGIAAVSMPMKVYRGRPRGSNQPVEPAHAFTGDIADTPALERWIAALAPPRR